MSIITEIREFKILPCKIDKELINSIGGIIESDSLCRERRIVYTLESRFRKIESKKSGEFTATDWPNDAKKVTVEVGDGYPRLINIQIDFKYTDNSKVSVSSSDATWANGISRRIEDAFAQKKLGYSTLIEDLSSRISVTILTWFSLSLALTYLVVSAYSRSGTPVDFTTSFWIISLFGGFLGGWFVVYFFLKWLFPTYEFGETIQKRFRKWIWSLLVGSGLIAVIVDELINRI